MGCIPSKISRNPYLKSEVPSKLPKIYECKSNKLNCHVKNRKSDRFLTVLANFQSTLKVIIESPLEQENSNIFE